MPEAPPPFIWPHWRRGAIFGVVNMVTVTTAMMLAIRWGGKFREISPTWSSSPPRWWEFSNWVVAVTVGAFWGLIVAAWTAARPPPPGKQGR